MEKVNGFGIASLVLGIVGILLMCAFGLSGLFGLIGLIFGILGLMVLKDAKKGLAIAGVIVSGVALFIGLGWLTVYGLRAINKNNNSHQSSVYQSEYVNDSGSSSYSTSEFSITAPDFEGSYENNNYYEIKDVVFLPETYGDGTLLVHRMFAKEDGSFEGTIIAYDSSGNIIEKCSRDVILTKGEYNYFRYQFDNDISNAKLEASVKKTNDPRNIGERGAVVMEKYNKSGDDLYVTLKQVKENIGSSASFDLILYKNGEIVGESPNHHVSVYAKNLNGVGSTDIAEIFIKYEPDFDSVEFIYEP